MELEYNYIENDPCHGCKYAVLKSKEQLDTDGIFSRRYICIDEKRRDKLELEIIHELSKKNYLEAHKLMSKLINLSYQGHQLFMHVCDELIPQCYTQI